MARSNVEMICGAFLNSSPEIQNVKGISRTWLKTGEKYWSDAKTENDFNSKPLKLLYALRVVYYQFSCLTDQWSLGIRQELSKLSKQVLLSLEETGDFGKHLIFGHPAAASAASTLLHLQLLLL